MRAPEAVKLLRIQADDVKPRLVLGQDAHRLAEHAVHGSFDATAPRPFPYHHDHLSTGAHFSRQQRRTGRRGFSRTVGGCRLTARCKQKEDDHPLYQGPASMGEKWSTRTAWMCFGPRGSRRPASHSIAAIPVPKLHGVGRSCPRRPVFDPVHHHLGLPLTSGVVWFYSKASGMRSMNVPTTSWGKTRDHPPPMAPGMTSLRYWGFNWAISDTGRPVTWAT